ncbi:MAG: DNA mismatch endonuclease Vsr [Magnetococcales bacterium]|nr:DNA mismatch endonuclease Vsr [Magnetococcales bacterium]
MDTLTPEERSVRMGLVRSKNTKPEMIVRRMIHRMGFRYRLHDARLPGTPDLVFRSQKLAIFVHGCFWHRHEGCALTRWPKSRLAFWEEKLESNRARDRQVLSRITEMNWRVLVVWECELHDQERLRSTLCRFLTNQETC